ncbi:MAG: hypothetical protein SFT91_02880 [Rickettsiaceae bacterium]|nr:hypothetical protein [Rickettsiaceae bacterium]
MLHQRPITINPSKTSRTPITIDPLHRDYPYYNNKNYLINLKNMDKAQILAAIVNKINEDNWTLATKSPKGKWRKIQIKELLEDDVTIEDAQAFLDSLPANKKFVESFCGVDFNIDFTKNTINVYDFESKIDNLGLVFNLVYDMRSEQCDENRDLLIERNLEESSSEGTEEMRNDGVEQVGQSSCLGGGCEIS